MGPTVTGGWRCSDSLLSSERGVVYLEFLVVFVPIWTFGLCVFQLLLIAQADLVVRQSAEAAARSAAVVLADDPAEYGGEPERSVARFRADADSLGYDLNRISTAIGSTSVSALVRSLGHEGAANLGRSRLNTIRLAAHVPLMPLAPSDVLPPRRSSLRGALSQAKSLAGAILHQPFAVAVTFPNAEAEYERGPETTVRVTYALACTVPIARHILCRSFQSVVGQSGLRQSFLTSVQGVLGGRYRRIEHEVSALVQDAPYDYRPRSFS